MVYQVYPRSFADADADGIGDLKGVTSRIPYLVSLGVDAVWLSPFYPSALADGGYDVDELSRRRPQVGTLDDFDEMAGALASAGLRLIVDNVDIVPAEATYERHQVGAGIRGERRVVRENGHALVESVGDGIGGSRFEPGQRTPGTFDRVEALDGRLPSTARPVPECASAPRFPAARRRTGPVAGEKRAPR